MKIGLLSILLMTVNAFATPVLRESAGAFKTNFVTIYPDDVDPNKFYFLPNSMNFAVDRNTGLPRFSLMTYGIENPNSPDAFGMMTFTFKAALTEDVRNELTTFQQNHPNAVLATMPVGESYLAVGESRKGIPAPGTTNIFKAWELPPFGGLLETEIGGNAFLTGAGAKMLSEAIRNGVSQVSQLQSCYTVDGVTPEMSAKITIDYQKVYSHFKSKAQTGWFIFGADVAKEVEVLRQTGSIDIKLRGDTKMEDAVMDMARELAKTYLVPKLENRRAGDPSSSFRLLSFGFNSSANEERNIVTYTYEKRVSIQDVRCISAPFSGLAPYANKLISNTSMVNP